MVIFWRLILGHLLADFTFQSNFINTWKRRSLWGMLTHCFMHPIVYVILTWPYLGEYWVDSPWLRLKGWACVLLLFALHFLEDQWRIFTIRRYQRPDNTLYLLWDQAVHFACIFVFFPVGPADLGPEGWFPETLPVVGCLLVLATHGSTILVYFLEKDFFGARFPDFDEKYLTMTGRFVLWMCFLVPGSLWPLFAVSWAALFLYLRLRRFFEYSWFSLGFGFALTALCGVLARSVYYPV